MELSTKNNWDCYQRLVRELLKQEPDEKLVKRCMQQLKIKWSDQKIDRLSQVLAYTPASFDTKGLSDDL